MAEAPVLPKAPLTPPRGSARGVLGLQEGESPTAADPHPLRPSPAPAAPDKRRELRKSTKRMLFVAVGLAVLLFSVLGFYLTSDAFDSRVRVLVTTKPIEPGQTVGFADFSFDEVQMGSIPHMPWTADAPFQFEGMVALQSIPAGGLVMSDQFSLAHTVPVGVELEAIIPLDQSLVTGALFEGQTVLLVDPGAEPTAGDEGRPRRVVREMELTNFDGSQMQLFVTPEEWADWDALLTEVGGTLMVKDLGVGADPFETATRLDAVWHEQWSGAAEDASLAMAETAGRAQVMPGELEVVVPLDASLAPSGVVEGDTVLLIDPGVEPQPGVAGRPQKVFRVLELENYSGGQTRMYLQPEEWLFWQSLPELLGAAPQVLPVPEGTVVEDMAARLNALWLDSFEQAQARVQAAALNQAPPPVQ